MDWTQVLTIVGSNLAVLFSTVSLFIWARSEANQDRRQLQETMEQHRVETHSMIKAIQEEMRDFHAKLLVIESRRN